MRRAQADDAPRIAALARWVWLDRYAIDGGVNGDVADYLKHEFDEQVLSRSPGHQWLIERGNALLAWAQLDDASPCPVESGGTAIELKRLYVSPRSQGQGLGARLLRQSRQDSPKQSLWLSAWVGNAGALRFYRREDAGYWGETWFELGGERHRNEVLGWPPLERST